MDFNEEQNALKQANLKKNRKTLVLLFMMFITPVLFAYAAYFGHWFDGASGSQGELIPKEQVLDIEDFQLLKTDGTEYTGKELETLYWWVLPLREKECDRACVDLNLLTVNQTYLGLGKESSRINELVVFEKSSSLDAGTFPLAVSEFSSVGLSAKQKTHSGKNRDLPSNYIYLVDPLGNIFMRYPLVKEKQQAPILSKKLRKDILHLFKYSRLG